MLVFERQNSYLLRQFWHKIKTVLPLFHKLKLDYKTIHALFIVKGVRWLLVITHLYSYMTSMELGVAERVSFHTYGLIFQFICGYAHSL